MTGPSDSDDFKRRNERLAKELLEGLGKPGVDPERESYEARKEQEDKAALEDFYRRTGQARDTRPRARTTTEMQFAASLEPCAHCASTEAAKLDLVGGGESWTLAGPCPSCKKARSHTWLTEGNPLHGTCPARQLGDAQPSRIIRVGQFMAELDRRLPRVHEQPESLGHEEWRASLAAMDRAITCLHELLKFVPAGRNSIPDTGLTEDELRDRAARRERYTQAWQRGELDRLMALHNRYAADAPRIWELERLARPALTPARGAINRDTLRAHEAWVRGRQQGAERLDCVGYNARGVGLGGVLFTGARLERVILDHANLGGAHMQRCELRDVSLRESNAVSLQLNDATLIGGAFERSALGLAVLNGAKIEGTSFAESNLDRTTWAGATVSGASFERVLFGNAWIDGARFRSCGFQGADFRPRTDLPRKPATSGAIFEDCDLRGTKWEGRDLTNATFIRCRFAGASGMPAAVATVIIQEPDLSAEGDGSRIGTAKDVLALLSGPEWP
ncbi:MAG TPA: pentapeptide repeat-containing protein [Myxococcus sp.]|nr:pentapeptide repeat-containing protein [Myxococcus sp.]